MCIKTSTFPSDAKRAEVIPIYKKESALERKNHRPVSILTTSSKILEKTLESDLNDNWLTSVYHDSLAAFRKGYNCQHVLLALCDKWRQVKEEQRMPGVLLADLSKAFDSLPFSLVIAKLQVMAWTKTLLC